LAVTENQIATCSWHADKTDRFTVIEESVAIVLKLSYNSGNSLSSHFGGSVSMLVQSTWACDWQSGTGTSFSTIISVFRPSLLFRHRCSYLLRGV